MQAMSSDASSAQDFVLPDEAATVALASAMATVLDGGLVVYMHGPLGAGKTSFARALLTALGVTDRIKSPTYTLLESYIAAARPAWHLDLYRIADPGELEWLGLDELVDPAALILVEWAERGAGALPEADLALYLDYAGLGRSASLRSCSARGEQVLKRLRASWESLQDTV